MMLFYENLPTKWVIFGLTQAVLFARI